MRAIHIIDHKSASEGFSIDKTNQAVEDFSLIAAAQRMTISPLAEGPRGPGRRAPRLSFPGRCAAYN